MKNQSKLLVIFTILLIAIPCLSAENFTPEDQCTWWDYILDIFREYNCGEITEYETPSSGLEQEPIKSFRYKNYQIIQTGEEYYYDVILEKDIKNGKLKIKVQKENDSKSIVLPEKLELKDEKGNILSSANLEIKGNKYEYNFEQNKKEKKVKIGKNSITIIKISDAEYLNSSRDLIENIYDYVNAEDNITYSANNGNYIRVDFEQELKTGNDISIYASGNGSIEIYKEGTNDLVGTISGISSYKKYSTMISNLTNRTDKFDLKIIGDLEIDYIVDPTGYFVMQIQTVTANKSFGLYLTLPVDFLILWGDGTNETFNTAGFKSHTYTNPGVYNISMNGQVNSFSPYYLSSGSPGLITDVLTNMTYGINPIINNFGTFFKGANQITNFTEPHFLDEMSKTIRSYYQTFFGASSFNGNLSGWNTTGVTTLEMMFSGASSFNQPINHFDTSSVTTMTGIFQNAGSFNQPLDNWDISKLTTMTNMFNGANSFNQNLTTWDTSKITSMASLFSGASSFNGNISNWNTSMVTNFNSAFQGTTSFNQSLENWDLRSATNLAFMFYASGFNGNISNWNVSKVTTMDTMFAWNNKFNQDISNWDVSKVTDMDYMFQGATSFNQNLSKWNVTSLTTANAMFSSMNLSTENYDSLLLGWSSQPVKNNVTFNGGNSKYSLAGKAGRDILINTYGWIITDGGSSECIPNITNSSWSAWEDISCSPNGTTIQGRYFKEYDSNECGSNFTETFYTETQYNGTCTFTGNACCPENGICTSDCKVVFLYQEDGWYADGGNCYSEYQGNNIYSDSSCDSASVNGTNGNCALYKEPWPEMNYYCPSGERMGRDVVPADCSCNGYVEGACWEFPDEISCGQYPECQWYGDEMNFCDGFYQQQVTSCSDSEFNGRFDFTQPFFKYNPISLKAPSNNYVTTQINNFFLALIDTERIPLNATLYIWKEDGSLYNSTFFYLGEDYSFIINDYDLNETITTYNWNYEVCFSEGCFFAPQNYTINLDLYAPQIEFVNPTVENNSYVLNSNFSINISIQEINLYKFIYNFNATNYSILDDSLSLFYTFDNYTRMNDSSIYKNNGEAQGEVYWNDSGINGGAYIFDGWYDGIFVGNDESVQLSEEFTLSAWIKSEKQASQNIIGKASCTSGARQDYSMNINSEGKAQFFMNAPFGDYYWDYNLNSNSVVNDGEWHLITMTFKNGTQENNVKIYIDGILDIADTTGEGVPTITNINLILGRNEDPCGSPSDFEGSMDEVRIYKRELSFEEIELMYKSKFTKNSLSDWNFYIDMNQYSFAPVEQNITYQGFAYDSPIRINQTEERLLTLYKVLCAPNITNTSWSEWENFGVCLPDDTLLQRRFRIEYDANDCGDFTNITHYDYKNASCDYCTPNLTNTSWSEWEDLECSSDGYRNQSSFLTQYDLNDCGEISNQTFYEYRENEDSSCDLCHENLVNTSKTGWINVGECINETQNQSRSWTEYDENDCGDFVNVTYYEYKTISCGVVPPFTPTAPTISLLNCRIPNTNPLCWFYSFGMSLISKNIILINGGILNIL